MKNMLISMVVLALPLLLSMPCRADPSETTRVLANQPVTMLTFGLSTIV